MLITAASIIAISTLLIGACDAHQILTSSEKFTLCELISGKQCIENFRVNIQLENAIGLIFLTVDFYNDPYLNLYIGWIIYLFERTLFNFRVLFIGLHYCTQDVTDCNNQFLSTLNAFISFDDRIIFASMQHTAAVDPALIATTRTAIGKKPGIFFHLNHETPWSKNLSDFRNNRFGLEDQLKQGYTLFTNVLRNYYYKPFENLVKYLPLGPGYYGIEYGKHDFYEDGLGRVHVHRYRRPYQNETIKRSSQRNIFCSLRCRFTYIDYSPFHQERSDISALVAMGNFPCAVQNSSMTTIEPVDLKYYSQLMSETVFAPCPGGNNPETFRHYEVHCETE